mgnify:CR=1 FL=1
MKLTVGRWLSVWRAGHPDRNCPTGPCLDRASSGSRWPGSCKPVERHARTWDSTGGTEPQTSAQLQGIRLTLSWTWSGPGGDVQMLYRATVKDGRMEGTWEIVGAVSQSLTASRRNKV